MVNKVLPEILKVVEDRQDNKLQRHNHWTGMMDGWTDISSNGVHGVLAGDTEEDHYIGNLPLNGKRYTAENLTKAFVELMGDRVSVIKAIVTDNENTMVAFRRELCTKFPHILNLRCVLHTLNLVCQDVVQHRQIKKTVLEISAMVVCFSNSHYWRQKLTQWGKSQGLTSFLAKYCETRWYTFVSMCIACSDYELGFKACVAEYEADPNKHPTINDKVIATVGSEIFETINNLILILKPLADSIGILERRDANISDVWKCFITVNNFYKNHLLSDTLPQKYIEIGSFVQKRLNDRAGDFNTDPYLIAFYMSPPHRKIATSVLGFKKMRKMIAKRVQIWNSTFTQMESDELKKCLREYQNNVYPHHSLEEDPIKYWKAQPDSILTRFAIQMLSFVP